MNRLSAKQVKEKEALATAIEDAWSAFMSAIDAADEFRQTIADAMLEKYENGGWTKIARLPYHVQGKQHACALAACRRGLLSEDRGE